MSNANAAPIQLADAPAADFLRGPVYDLNPTAGPALDPPPPPHAAQAAVACPAPANANGVLPMAVHEPLPGQHVDINVTPTLPLSFDFNPLDATATRHGDNLTLTFPDGGVMVLHDITQHGIPLPTPLALPDGTVINPCELLQALPGPQENAEANKIPNEKIPLEEIIPAGAHPVVTPFELPGFGPGLTPLGPLGPVPPGPPSPPPFPPPPFPPPPPPTAPFLVAIEDSNIGVYGTSFPITGNFLTDFTNSGGAQGVSSSPAATFLNFTSVSTGATTGQFGTLAVTAGGAYTYTLDATGTAALSTLGSDRISEMLSQQQHPGTPAYLVPLADEFVGTVTNGTQTVQEPIQFWLQGNDPIDSTAQLGGTPAGAGTTKVMLTFTDTLDPAHSFQEAVTVNGGVASITTGGTPIQPGDPALVSAEYLSGPAVSNLSLTIGGESVAIGSGLTLGPVSASDHEALTAIYNNLDSGSATPAIASNEATTFATLAGQYVYDNNGNDNLYVAGGSPAYYDGAILNLGSADLFGPPGAAGGSETGGLGSNVLVLRDNDPAVHYQGGVGGVIGGTPTVGDILSITVTNPAIADATHSDTISYTVHTGDTSAAIATDLASLIDANSSLSGIGLSATPNGSTLQYNEAPGTAAFGQTTYVETAASSVFGTTPTETFTGQAGLDTLRVDGTGQNINLTNPAVLSHFANLEVIDLSGAASTGLTGTPAANALTLNPADVLQLTQNENATIPSFGGGANALWVLGTANDTVNLQGFHMISGPVTSADQIPGLQATGLQAQTPVAPTGVDGGAAPAGMTSPTQMVGFTEFSNPTNNVHVYVENAIANAGTPHLHLS